MSSLSGVLSPKSAGLSLMLVSALGCSANTPIQKLFGDGGNVASDGGGTAVQFDGQVVASDGGTTDGGTTLWSDGQVVVDGGGTNTGCEQVHSQGKVRTSPVDVVWVIDDSLSMLDDITRIQNNMAAFTSSLVQRGLDYHVVVLNEPSLTAAPPWDAAKLGVDPSRFFPVSAIAWNDCFTPALTYFDSYSADLRPDAALHFIMVSDDNSLMSWSDFQTQMEAKLGNRPFTVHAIVDPPQHCLGSTRPGTAYWEAAAATGGQQRSICEADWTPTFTALEDTIQSTAEIPCQYGMPDAPAGKTYNLNKVNVEYVVDGASPTPWKHQASADACGTEAGWYYDDPSNPTQVLLCPAACKAAEDQGGSVNIVFVCNADQLY